MHVLFKEYVVKKEKQLEERRKKPRMTARQQQIKKDNELWENNRLARSGVVALAEDLDENYEEEAENRVNLLVHNMVPPFLDGRIVFTKQPEPVVPVSLCEITF
jgi:pre-mRNA-splicing factor ATP-dependent RNA helicase DHX38/PRP16